jgi:hypothetical protein
VESLPQTKWLGRMSYSLKNLAFCVTVAALACAAMTTLHEWWRGVFHIMALCIFLMSLVYAVYGHDSSRAFGVGAAICSGVPLLLIYVQIGIVGDAIFPIADSTAESFLKPQLCDLLAVIILGSLGGNFAKHLQQNRPSG